MVEREPLTVARLEPTLLLLLRPAVLLLLLRPAVLWPATRHLQPPLHQQPLRWTCAVEREPLPVARLEPALLLLLRPALLLLEVLLVKERLRPRAFLRLRRQE